MDCFYARLEELLAFALEKEPLSAAAHQHLDSCSFCQHRVRSYRKLMTYAVFCLYRASCPSATTLSYYCLPGMLTENERDQIAEHLACCPLCAHELVETREFLAAS
jgi:hypothetical protein